MKLYSKEGLFIYFFLVVLLNNKANASSDDMHEDIEGEMDQSVLPIDAHSTVDVHSKHRSNLCDVPALNYIGTEPSTLLNCVGDCKGDGDCDPVLGLECTGSNTYGDRITGCKGRLGVDDGANQYSHYCSNDKILRRLPAEEGYLPMKQCEGNCRSNTDCGDGLVCRDISKDYEPGSRAEPGCSNACNVSLVGAKFCVPPEVMLLPYTSDSPNMCEQCYEDDECPPLQVCTSYDGLGVWFESVPGCSLSVEALDENEPDMKFCTKPFATGVVGIQDNVNTRLGLCEGNCKDNNDCIGSLECYKREENEVPPGCNFKKEGNGRFFSLSKYNFCHQPRMRSWNKEWFTGKWGDGDCDSDSDCIDGYKCAQRNGYTTLQFTSGNGLRNWDYCTPTFPFCPKKAVNVGKILKDDRTTESQRYRGENHCCLNFPAKFGKQVDYGVVPVGGSSCDCDGKVGYTYFWQIKGDWRVKIGCAKHSKNFKGKWERNCFMRIRDETKAVQKGGTPVDIEFFCAKVTSGYGYMREMYNNFDNYDFKPIGPPEQPQSCNAAEVIMQDYAYCDGNWLKRNPSLHQAVKDDKKGGKTEWFAKSSIQNAYLKELEALFKEKVPNMEIRKGTTTRKYRRGPGRWKIEYNTW